ncbi:hypothetical protein C0J52_03704 [Blattella germanica]|nr:hypothetical protein C0J52_03704 [Blattella germanica]
MVAEDESVPNITVTLRHVQLILALYAAFIASSIIILLFEILWYKRASLTNDISNKYKLSKSSNKSDTSNIEL